MTRRRIAGPATIAVAFAIASAATAHPSHVTIAEADFNAGAGTLEVAIRVDNPGDLEEAIGRRAGERVDLERTEGVDAMILDYLREALVVGRGDGERAAIGWVGKEVSVKTAWLYVEIPMPGGPEGATFTNTLLFEVEPDQVNTMVFGRGNDRATLRFTRDAPTHTLRALPDPKPDGR